LNARLVVAAVLLCSLAGGLWWVASLAPRPGDGEGTHAVFIVAPDASVLANATVTSRPTPLAVLQALSVQRGVAIEVEQKPAVGSGCTAAYVVSIAGIRETTTGGWNYYVRQPGAEWAWKPAGAACYGLAVGDQVEWCWVESDVCRHHVA
jgi:hypothetical protein